MSEWALIGSAGSLEAVQAMVRERWYWSVCDTLPTDDPKVWQVASFKGVVDGVRIRQAGKRYRFEQSR